MRAYIADLLRDGYRAIDDREAIKVMVRPWGEREAGPGPAPTTPSKETHP